MKTLLSGIIGAAASTVGWFALVHNFEGHFPYLALAVGAVTGFAVRKAAAANSGESIAQGAMAAVIALAACVGGEFGYKAFMENVNKNAEKPQLPQVIAQADEEESAEPADGEDAAEENEDAVAEGDDAPERRPLDVRQAGIDSKDPAFKIGKLDTSKGSMLDLIWLCGSALLAYVVGKGSNAAAPGATEEAAGESESPAEPEEQQGEG